MDWKRKTMTKLMYLSEGKIYQFQSLQSYSFYNQLNIMEQDGFQKQMFSTNHKEKIFKVRKRPYKQFDHQKYLKSNFSPFQKKQNQIEPPSLQPTRKAGEYNFQVAIISTVAYKELSKKYQLLKEQQAREKQIKLQNLRRQEEELIKCQAEKQRLANEKQKLQEKRDELKQKIEQIRDRNEAMRAQKQQRNEEYRVLNMEYLRNMIIGMRYQNGIEIDPDNMTYEQLLQLEEKMGSVSKGLKAEQIARLHKKIIADTDEEHLCSICYENAKPGEIVVSFTCKHSFHEDCIHEWVKKEKVCPMCKREIEVATETKITEQQEMHVEEVAVEA